MFEVLLLAEFAVLLVFVVANVGQVVFALD